MKRTFNIFLSFIIILTANAQVQQQIAIQIGSQGNLLRQNSSTDNTVKLANNLNGPQIGIAYDVDFYKGIGLYLAANYSYGVQIKQSTPDMTNNFEVRTTTVYHSVNIPIDLQYRFLLAHKTWISIYTGPMFQVGLKMQQLQTTEQPIAGLDPRRTKTNEYQYSYDYFIISNQANANKLSDADNDGRRDYNRFNPLWSLGGAFQFHQFYIRGGYSWGLANLYYDRTYTNLADQTLEWKRRMRHDEWSISIGWYFAYTDND